MTIYNSHNLTLQLQGIFDIFTAVKHNKLSPLVNTIF